MLEPSFVPARARGGQPAAWIVLGARRRLLRRARACARRARSCSRGASPTWPSSTGSSCSRSRSFPGLLMEYYELGWWLGHGWELIGIGWSGVPVALDLHRGAQSRPLVRRPARQRARERRGRLHGPDGARAAGAAGAQGRLHRRAHARRGAAGRAGRRGARAGAGAAARAGDRRPRARRRASSPCRTRSSRSPARSRTRSTT